MIDERLETQASLYALGALPPDEAREFERALAADPELQRLVADLRDAAGAVLLASPQIDPPPALKQKILDRLESSATAESKVVRLESPSRSALFEWLPWALAACLAVLCGIAVTRLKDKRDFFADAQIATMSSTNSQVVVVWNHREQKGRLQVFQLPVPPKGKDYQLWVLAKKDPAQAAAPVSAGVISMKPNGTAEYTFTATAPITIADKFAISLEPAGGSAKPTEVILVSN